MNSKHFKNGQEATPESKRWMNQQCMSLRLLNLFQASGLPGSMVWIWSTMGKGTRFSVAPSLIKLPCMECSPKFGI